MTRIIEIDFCSECRHEKMVEIIQYCTASYPWRKVSSTIPTWCPLPDKPQIGKIGVAIDNFADMED